jgi:amino acid transporter
MDEKGDVQSTGTSSHFYADEARGSVFHRVVESFKRDPHAHTTPKGSIGANGKVFDLEVAAANTAESPLARKLKGRHLQMIAIGGSIGSYWLLSCWLTNVR